MISIQDMVVLGPFLLLLFGSIYLSFQTRFVQLRTIPRMFSLLWQSFFSTEHSQYTIKAHKALFTAMSTTIGVTNIVGPLIAIGFSGPGALLGYLLATLFGSAATFAEVTFALKYRDPAPLKDRVGGPMHYLNQVFHPVIGWLYAFCGTILIIFWSGAQSNALATMLKPYHVPPMLTGTVLAGMTIFILIGGIKRVGNVAEKLVPIMFLLYTGAMIWIIGCNADKLGSVMHLIFTSAFQPEALTGGIASAGLMQALRWGLAKGFTSNESGIGTATVPHSMAETKSAIDQGILSIISVFSNGVLCLLSGIAVLITGMYQDYSADSITIITKLFAQYFPLVGPTILLISASLFVISTVIGNGYNGTQFCRYALGKRWLYVYYGLCALSIFVNALVSVETVWRFVDFLVLPVVVPHIIGLILLAHRHRDMLNFRADHSTTPPPLKNKLVS